MQQVKILSFNSNKADLTLQDYSWIDTENKYYYSFMPANALDPVLEKYESSIESFSFVTRSMDVIGGKGVDSVLSNAKIGDKSRLHNMREA